MLLDLISIIIWNFAICSQFRILKHHTHIHISFAEFHLQVKTKTSSTLKQLLRMLISEWLWQASWATKLLDPLHSEMNQNSYDISSKTPRLKYRSPILHIDLCCRYYIIHTFIQFIFRAAILSPQSIFPSMNH